MQFLLKITVLVVGGLILISAHAKACPYDEPVGNSSTEVKVGIGMSELELKPEDRPVTTQTHDHCCSICKVYSMNATNFYIKLTIPYISLDHFLFQEGDCRNANSGMWHPPKRA